MVIRKIQLISNTYRNENLITEMPLGNYCVFGPFDALDIGKEASAWEASHMEEVESSEIVSWCDGKSSRCNVICAFRDTEQRREEEFIQRCKRYPYLFVSLLLLKHGETDSGSVNLAKEKMIEVNGKDNFRAYFSLGKNEIVLLHYCKSYSDGLMNILGEHAGFNLAKASTVFAVQEDALAVENLLYQTMGEKEIVNCRLRGVMRDRSEANIFLKQLGNYIMAQGGSNVQIRWYDVLGGADILIEIDDVLLVKLLPLYKSGNIMTHMNPQYTKAWYNVETEFISRKKGVDYGGQYRLQQSGA